MNGPPGGWRRRTFASLAVPAYRTYFYAFIVVMTGFWVRIAAVGWYVYELTASTNALGIVTAAALMPFVLFSPAGGALADRVDERRIISRLMIAIVLVNAGLAALIFMDVARYEHVIVYSFIAGCFRALEHPARNALVVRLVGRDRLHNAIGLNAACFHFTSTLGPLIAGLVYHFGGPGTCFVIVAVSALPIAIVIPGLEARERAIAPREPFRKQLTAGFGYVWSHRATRALMLTAAASIFLVWSFRTIMPAVSKDALGLGDIGYGLLMSVTGVGSFLGALWVASGGTRRLSGAQALVPLVIAGCIGVATLGAASAVWLAALGLVVAGFFHVGFMASANTQVQMMVPDALRARVMGIWALTFGACWPLGGLWMGALAEARDTRFAILVSVSVAVLCVFVLRATRGRRSAMEVPKDVRQLEETYT
ncbi:MAG: MFS transporter [Planctomycetota bacterium]|nr:MFS transporter [Planctomycetota bacterium]